MGRSVTALLLASLCWGFAGAPEAAEEATNPVPNEGIEALNTNLERIAEALESLRADQRVLLMLRRLELAERRIAPLQNRLEGARGEVRSRQEEIAQLEAVTGQFEDTVQEAVRSGADPSAIPERGELERMRSLTELARERLADAERRVIEVEDEIAASRRRIEILDEIVEDLLEQGDELPDPERRRP